MVADTNPTVPGNPLVPAIVEAEPPLLPHHCGAKRKNGKRCRRSKTEHGRCIMHGGAHGTGRPITHGRYSGIFVKMREAFESSMNDPSLMDLREPVAVLDVLVKKAIARAESADTPELRRRALSMMEGAHEAGQAGDGATAARLLSEVTRLLREGVREDLSLRQLAEATDRLHRALEGSWSVALSRRNAINARDLVVILGRFADVVRGETEPAQFSRIMSRIDSEVMNNAGRSALKASNGNGHSNGNGNGNGSH